LQKSSSVHLQGKRLPKKTNEKPLMMAGYVTHAATPNRSTQQTDIETIMEIRKILVLSTSHITKKTLYSEAWPKIGDFENGAYFYVTEDDIDITVDKTYREDLGKVLKFAQSIGAREVKFDQDADIVDELPVYEWE
jgi:hypothetical protein